ncbi:MAG: M36 family metallopeptidase [Kofleriaceae bacterium]
MSNRLLVSLVLIVGGCGDSATNTPSVVDRSSTQAPPALPAAAAIRLGMAPLSVDEHGVPRLMAATDVPVMPGATATEQALAHVQRLAPAWGARVPQLVGVGEVAMPGGTIVRLRQLLDGLPIDDGELHVFVRGDGGLVGVSGTMVDAGAVRATPAFVDDDAAAIARAIRANFHVAFDAHVLVPLKKRTDALRILTGRSGSIIVAAANATKVWSRAGNGLVAAWSIDVDSSTVKSTAGDGFHMVLAGADGRVLAHHSLVANDAFDYRVFADATGEKHPFDGPVVDPTPNVGGVGAPYPAFVVPNLVSVASLDHLNDPWLPAAAVDSNGNNVDAYTDVNAPDGFSSGDLRATLTGANAFDRTYDVTAAPLVSPDQQMAAVTALFYTTNWLHDFWYDNGFIEATGNAQLDNYGRGGVDGDPLHAEAEDDALGAGINNANMSTPGDGMSPRLQVYVWTGTQSVAISYPGHTPAGNVAAFGPTTFDATATATLTTPATGCAPLTTPVTGMIAVIDRGGCTFKTKALNALNAGAAGMVLVDSAVGGFLPPALGDDATISTAITFGTLSVTLAEGALLKTAIAGGPTTVVLHRGVNGVEHDGDLDASVLAHEYGHYLHHRLSNCGAALCGAMSEGWGDFDALMFVLRAGDNLDGAFPLAIYSTAADIDAAYFGIRRAPYSVDPTINGLSFRHMAAGAALPTGQPFLTIGNNNEVHNAGEIWAETLWEAYVALQKAGSSYTATRATMAKYVVGGLLMTPTDTTPTETRDAILLAARAASVDDYTAIASAFARRGMGTCAISPDRDSTTFTGIVESTEVKGRLFAAPVTSSDSIVTCDEDGNLDATESGRIYIPVANTGQAAMTNLSISVTTTTPGVTITSPPTTLAMFAIGQTIYATADVAVDATLVDATAGDFTVAITADNACTAIAQPVGIRLNVDDIPASSRTDTFDVPVSVWSASSSNWDHTRASALDGVWVGADQGSPSDVMLTSPPLVANATADLSVTFDHTYQFEATFDGGVIEYTVDNGATWADVATLTGITPGYTDTLDINGGNALAGRLVFSGTNPAFPAIDTVTLDFGTQLAGRTFRLRFRIGTDAAVGATGWTIDNVAFTGIDNLPFPTQVADQHICVAPGHPPDAGISGDDAGTPSNAPLTGGCCDAGPMRTGNVMIAFGVLVVLRRRRRRT